MKLANRTTVIAKPYQKKDAEEIIHLIVRNFREINAKDYDEKLLEWAPYQVFGEVLRKIFY